MSDKSSAALSNVSGATGSDHLVYEVTNPTGEVGTYDVTITIKNPAGAAQTVERIEDLRGGGGMCGTPAPPMQSA